MKRYTISSSDSRFLGGRRYMALKKIVHLRMIKIKKMEKVEKGYTVEQESRARFSNIPHERERMEI